MTTRLSIALLLCGIASSVLFGVGAIVILSIPQLAVHAPILLPAVIVASLILAPVICWVVAPTLRAKHSREQNIERQRLEALATPG